MAKTPATGAKAASPKKPTAKKPAAAAKAAPAKAAVTGEAKEKFAKAIEEAKAGAQALTRQAQDKAGEYRVRFKYNAEVMFSTEGYATKSSAQNAIASLKKNAPDAPVVDNAAA